MEAKTESSDVEPKQLFGHPRGLSFLFATEMWERFSYYGMRALLVLYLVKHVLLPENSSQVIGLSTLKDGFETIFGPLEAQPFASQIYGTYTALVYLTPIFGGLLADRVLGQRKTVVIGATLMAIGHFMMAFEPLLLFALLTLILQTASSSRISRRKSAASTRKAIHAATAPIRFFTSASTLARSWRRWSAERWARNGAGITGSARRASAW